MLSAGRCSQHDSVLLYANTVEKLICLILDLADTVQLYYETDRVCCRHSHEQHLVWKARQNLSFDSRLLAGVYTFPVLIFRLADRLRQIQPP